MGKKISVSELSSSQLKDNLRIHAKEKSDLTATSDSAIREILLDNAPHIFKKKDGGMMNKRLKSVDKNKNPGLAKLPTGVRNKMGYMKKGGVVKKKSGGMVLEIGLRPATEKEMKMAKDMKPKKKANGGMVSRGTGAADTGKGFKGVF